MAAVLLCLSLAVISQGQDCHDEGSALLQTGRVTTATVDQLITFGAPGTADQGLVHEGRDKCFPGIRVITSTHSRYGSFTDPVPMITGLVPLWHINSDLHIYDAQSSKVRVVKCSERDVLHWPKPRILLNLKDYFPLHYMDLYSKVTKTSPEPVLRRLSSWAAELSYLHDASAAAELVKKNGYHLIGAALYKDAGDFRTQSSFLVQDVKTMECVMTFQGTASPEGWAQDLNTVKAEYCGLSSLVHQGFRDELQRMTRFNAFQQNIRSKLPYCQRVTLFGHSLGGGIAELFTACVSHAPQKGSVGYGDFNSISWSKKDSKLLPETTTFDILTSD